MDGSAILEIGGVVGTLAKFLVGAGVRGVWATLGSVAISAAACYVWIVSYSAFTPALAWSHLAGFAAVLLTAGGAFHVIENAPSGAQVKAAFGGGTGGGQ